MGSRYALVTGVVTLAAAGAISGCGSSSSSSSSAGNQVERAAFVSTSTSGYRMHFAMVLSSAGLPQPITAAGVGRVNVQQHTGSTDLAMNLGNSPQVVQALGTSTLNISELVDGTTLYIKLPEQLTSKVPALGSKPWLKIDVAKAASAAGIPGLGSLVNNPASSDPGQFLQYLRAAGTVTKVGTQTINGFSTTQYHGVIDLDKVPSSAASSSRSQEQAAISGLEKATGLHQIPVDVWIDNQNLVRRIRMNFHETASGQAIGVGITVDILEYGPQPPPAIPPASQVTDASSLAGATGG
jgi:hypothetical protein